MNSAPVIAVKCYGYAWMLEHGLSEAQAARRMHDHGIDWALLQNTIDPLPTSGVEQLPPSGAHDPRRFRDLVRKQGIKTYESTAVFFQPAVNAARPDLRPRDAAGREMTMFDWYLGVSPHSRAYLTMREELMARVVDSLQPDGIFLSFIRFPGFWEAWTPSIAREEIEDFGFSDGAIERFQVDTGISLGDDRIVAVNALQHELNAEWVSWKVSVIVESVDRLRRAARAAKPDVEVLINGLAFAADERGDLGVDVAGQDLGAISGVAEHVESMVYHQILGRPASPWIGDTLAALRPQVKGTLLGSVQTSPTYTDGIHAGHGRRADWTPAEFRHSLGELARAGADGVSVYHWSDLVADEQDADGEMVRALRAYKDGKLS